MSTENTTDAPILIYHHVGFPMTDMARAKRYGFGKRSGRGRLTAAAQLAFRRLLDDLDAGKLKIADLAQHFPDETNGD